MKGEFYKMDFRAWNTGTIDLTLEQEAAYLRLCHAMYDIGGPIPDSIRLLMSILRCSNAKAAGLVRQLVRAGKIQRTGDKKLSNRRVMAELADRDKLSKTRSAAGEIGGRARHGKGGSGSSDPRVTPECYPSERRVTPECYPSERRVTPECPSTDHRVSPSKPLNNNDQPQANASTLRSRGEERRGESPIVPKGTDSDGFAEFWEAYPKRRGDNPRRTAMRAYAKAIKDGTEPAAILRAVRTHATEMRAQNKIDSELVPMASTWLNQGRFERHVASGSSRDGSPPTDPTKRVAAIPDETMRAYLRRWRDTSGQWLIANLSEPPDDPRTRVPARILAEFGIVHPGAQDQPATRRRHLSAVPASGVAA